MENAEIERRLGVIERAIGMVAWSDDNDVKKSRREIRSVSYRAEDRINACVQRLDALEKRVNQEQFAEWYVKKVQESMEGAMADACADALRHCVQDSVPWTAEREPVPASNPAPRPAPTTTTPSDPLAEAARRVVILRITDLSKGTTYDESIYNSGRIHVVGKDLEVMVE